ncbi:FG-GAP-like repeat-containing protein [Flavisolibacter nicotianae]|uniref:FG-GAP-like repeat-containing protein n=1 Tax=Flavisolibacter nicotianae TaxID=2364882 RepID=UPI000EB35124|nr:FG-GAP-like repeat-containing protein [Flavisolibacter nicotianae]
MKIAFHPFSYLLIASCLFAVSCKNKPLFHQLSSSKTGIHFNNKIVENDSINPIDLTNIYNGGGVGIGDFNNDGLQDVYFTGNLVPNQLYLNKGNMEFRDITKEAGVEGQGRWSRGVAVVDINNDGWLDMYVCATMLDDPQKRQNLLYVNQGAKTDGVPRFKEMAADYGLNDTTHSTMAAFFDYDNDGDLDMYLAVNQIIKGDNPSVFRPRITDGHHPSTGRLYRNDFDSARRHPYFTDVSHEAGVTIEGYGHGVTIADFNRDGWKDIFVTNDFNSTDLLYINNHNGTFTDKATTYFKHTSANGMGQDVIDINNDGLSDVVELDMNPEDNFRKKMMMNGNSYQTYQNSDHYGYQYQYVRNSLQLNQGPRVLENDSIGDPIFSDVGYFSGIAETDWSWTPLVTDFDNDGYRDIVVSNGYPKDVTDHDFVAFRRDAFSIAPKKYLLEQIPQVKLHNYAFRNKGNATFDNATQSWGLMEPSFSNGGAYADLDNDGDMDMIINNINDEAFVYENRLNDNKDEPSHYLGVQLAGAAQNRNGLGAWVEVYYGGQQQVYEQTPYRGYLSTVQLQPHFGLGKATSVDSLVVKWPNGRKQVLRNVKADEVVNVSIANANETYDWSRPALATEALLVDVTKSLNINLQHVKRDFIDFNVQKLLPHKYSEYGPAIAVGDVNGDGLDDMVVGGNFTFSTTFLLQQANGSFSKSELPRKDTFQHWVNTGLALFDADGDGDLDLYVARGGYEAEPGSKDYQDELWLNGGRGMFTQDTAALPQIHTSKSCIRPFDYDNDGDLDLFVAGRVDPWNYPKPVASTILRNDSRPGKVAFTDVTASVAPFLSKAGLISDVVSTDFDGDGWTDLVMAGEWMPVRFLKNEKGTFKEVTASTGAANHVGWWNSILPGDFDNDGDVDYVVSNLGLNSFYRGSEKEPVSIYAKDFDNNGSLDAIPTLYLPRSNDNAERKEFPAHTRDDISKQMISFKSKFQNYRSYATATFSEMFKPAELKDALVLHANDFRHCLLKNTGNAKFEMVPLPLNTQYVCLNGMVAEDVDGDGNLDIVASGNDYSTEPSVGRYDACNGLVLKGDGKGGFTPLSILQSGLFIPENGKALVKLRNAKGQVLIAASQYRGPMKVFLVKEKGTLVPVAQTDVSVLLHLKNGAKQKQEIGYGSSFLSQSARFVTVGKNVGYAEIHDRSGNVRTIGGKENRLTRR